MNAIQQLQAALDDYDDDEDDQTYGGLDDGDYEDDDR